MTEITGTVRPLPYPLKHTVDMESDTDDEQITEITLENWSTNDPDERINIVLNLSLNEYTALANTIDVGRDIAYGDNSIAIWFLWVRTLQTMTICQAIIDCINDPESGVSQAIITAVSNESSESSIIVGQGQSNLLLGDGNNPSCDLDTWWGGIDNMVNQLDINNLDSLQILEVSTNIQEWVVQVATGIFGVEAPIVQSMLDWALFIQNSIQENYEAQVTTAYLDELKCDLFCIAKLNCELKPQDIVDYFFDRLQSQLTFNSLLTESLEFIFLGSWSGTEIADVMFLSQLVFRAQFGRWFVDIAFNSVDLDLRLGFNDPSDDWVLLCDTCITTYTITFDDLSSSDWIISADVFSGTEIIAPIIQDTFGNPQPSALSARYESPTPNFGLSLVVRVELTNVSTVESVDFEYYYTTPYANNVLGRRVQLFDDQDILIELSFIDTGNNAPKSQWNSIDGSPSTPVANVKYIDVSIQVSSAAISTYANCRGWLDNIVIGVQ